MAAITVTVHRKLSRVWPRVEFPSDFDEGLVARNLIDCAKTVTAVVLHAFMLCWPPGVVAQMRYLAAPMFYRSQQVHEDVGNRGSAIAARLAHEHDDQRLFVIQYRLVLALDVEGDLLRVKPRCNGTAGSSHGSM